MFKGINTRDELFNRRSKKELEKSQEFLQNVFEVLSDEVYHESQISQRIASPNQDQLPFKWSELNALDVFSLNEIKNLCLTYRLRFLDSHLFQGEIPKEAVVKIKNIEKRLGREITNFKIAAPTEKFELVDCEKDPLLFIELSDNYYYLVHQWGNDLSWHRPMLVLPLRNKATLAITIGLLSFFLTYVLPFEWLFGLVEISEFLVQFSFFAWVFIVISAIVSIGRHLFLTDVSEKQWNNPYLKPRK